MEFLELKAWLIEQAARSGAVAEVIKSCGEFRRYAELAPAPPSIEGPEAIEWASLGSSLPRDFAANAGTRLVTH